MRSRLVSVYALIAFQAVTHTVNGQCPQQKVIASDAACGDSFGSAVETDGTVAVIASPSDDHLGVNAGSVYVFRRDGGRVAL